jgi:hypothetical protein
VGPRAGLDDLEREKSLVTVEIRNPSRLVRSLVAIPTELSWLSFKDTQVIKKCNYGRSTTLL